MIKIGERYQIHIKVKEEKNNDAITLISIHSQWCWGTHIIRNLHRLLTTLNESNLEYTREDELKKYIESILVVNRSINGTYYPYRVHIEKSSYKTMHGDSNHGWCVIQLTIKKDGSTTVQSRFYNINADPVTNEQLWDDALYELKHEEWDDESQAKLKSMLENGLFNNTKADLQEEFNSEIKNGGD